MLVVNTYKLLMRGTTFVMDGKQIQQEKQVITEEWYEEMMLTPKKDRRGDYEYDERDNLVLVPELWKKTGFFIEVLEDETKKWKVKFEKKQEKMRQMKEIEAAKSSDILSRAIASSLDSQVKEAQNIIKDLPSGIPNDSWEVEEIKEWLLQENVPFGIDADKEALLKVVKYQSEKK